MKQVPIALQLYTVRDDAERDLSGTLAEIARIGYTRVELAGFYGHPVSEVKRLLSHYGISVISAHVGLKELEAEDIGKVIDDYLNLGAETLVVPFIGEDVRKSGSGYAAIAGRLNNVGELLGRYGIGLGYHNHAFEFTEMVGDKRGIDFLIEETDPALVTFELDTYWALSAGVDPVEFIERHSTRLTLLHIKDMDREDRSFAPIATGLLPLPGIVTSAVDAGVSYLIVEQDTAKGPPLEEIAISLENLRAIGYA